MKLEWFGHACFRLMGEGGSVVFDPYADGSVHGLKLMRLFADAVICSHDHSDHNAADKVVTSGRKMPFELKQIPCFHDEARGALRGDNTISVVTVDGLTVAHMGDIGHMLDDDRLSALGRVDILLLPVGGVYTLDAEAAFELYRKIAPGVVVPMHYRSGSIGLQNVAPVSDFLRLFDRRDIHSVDKVWDTDEYAVTSGVVLFTDALRF